VNRTPDVREVRGIDSPFPALAHTALTKEMNGPDFERSALPPLCRRNARSRRRPKTWPSSRRSSSPPRIFWCAGSPHAPRSFPRTQHRLSSRNATAYSLEPTFPGPRTGPCACDPIALARGPLLPILPLQLELLAQTTPSRGKVVGHAHPPSPRRVRARTVPLSRPYPVTRRPLYHPAYDRAPEPPPHPNRLKLAPQLAFDSVSQNLPLLSHHQVASAHRDGRSTSSRPLRGAAPGALEPSRGPHLRPRKSSVAGPDRARNSPGPAPGDVRGIHLSFLFSRPPCPSFLLLPAPFAVPRLCGLVACRRGSPAAAGELAPHLRRPSRPRGCAAALLKSARVEPLEAWWPLARPRLAPECGGAVWAYRVATSTWARWVCDPSGPLP